MQVPWRDRRGRFLWLKAVVLPALFVPGLLYAFWLATHDLGGRPVIEAIHGIGLWAIRLVMISLAITPLARALDWPGLLLVRRMVGVSAACYAFIHLCLYVVDQNFKLGTVVSEIALRFYLTIGLVALLGLLALAATSTDGMVQRLGRNWKRLRKTSLSDWGYCAAALFHPIEAECVGAGIRFRPVHLADAVARASGNLASQPGDWRRGDTLWRLGSGFGA